MNTYTNPNLLTLLKSSEFSRLFNCSSAASINPCMAVTTVRIVRLFFFFITNSVEKKECFFGKEKKNS